MIERLWVRLLTTVLLGINCGQVVHIHVPLSLTKRYNSVSAKGRWCSAAGKVTEGLASHWPCIADSVVYPPMGSTAWEGDENAIRCMAAPFAFFYYKIQFCSFCLTDPVCSSYSRWGHVRWGRVGSGEVRSSQVRSGRVGSGEVGPGPQWKTISQQIHVGCTSCQPTNSIKAP